MHREKNAHIRLFNAFLLVFFIFLYLTETK